MAGRGALPARVRPGGRAGPPCTAGGRGAAEPPGAAGFSSDTHLGRVCVAPDRARLGKGAGRLGFVTALLGAGEARARWAPRERLGTGPAAVGPGTPSQGGASAVAGVVRPGEPWPGGCSVSDPGVAASLEDQCRGRFWPRSVSGWSPGLWVMVAKLRSCLLPQVLPSTGSTAPAIFIART